MHRRLTYFFLLLFLLFAVFAPGTVPAQSINLAESLFAAEERYQAKPEDATLAMDLAALYVEALKFQDAITLYEKVISRDDKNKRATIELCALYTMMRERSSAVKYCSRWVELDEKNYEAHDNLGLCFFKFGEFLAALKPFSDAWSLQPKSVLVGNHVALTFLALGESIASRDLFLELLKLEGLSTEDKALLYHGLYLAYNNLKQRGEALAAIKNTYNYSANPLYLGKIITAAIRKHQIVFFVMVAVLMLGACQYFGKRLNRFLKNED